MSTLTRKEKTKAAKKKEEKGAISMTDLHYHHISHLLCFLPRPFSSLQHYDVLNWDSLILFSLKFDHVDK
jgi:hypothetical protein